MCKCGYHKHLSRKHLQLLEINKIIILECYFLEQNIHYVKWKRKNVLFILVEARLNYVLKLLLPKCFIVQKLSGWFYHTDGKRCAFCLTCGKKPLEIRTNDFTSFKTKITPRVDEIPFLIRELTFKPQTSATFLKAKGKKMHIPCPHKFTLPPIILMKLHTMLKLIIVLAWNQVFLS